MRGPIDYLVVEFPGNRFKGDILRELNTAVHNGTIAVLDMSLITKDTEGNVSGLELSTAGDDAMLALESPVSDVGGLITPEDVEEVGDLIDDNSSAGLLVIEQLWAKGLKKAIVDADGILVAEGRIHPEASRELNAMEV